MPEIEFSRWLFELPAKWNSQFSPSGSIFLSYLGLPSKSHRENSISSTFFESPLQVDMKNVVKSSKHFFGYFNTLKTHSETTLESGTNAAPGRSLTTLTRRGVYKEVKEVLKCRLFVNVYKV